MFKKIVSALLICSLIFALCAQALCVSAEETNSLFDDELYIENDLNGDGKLNASDLLVLKQLILGEIDSVQSGNPDVNGDKNVDILDIIALKKILTNTYNIWDLSNVESNTVVANMGNVAEALWFKESGKSALLKTTVTRIDTSSVANRESQPFFGVKLSDGTNTGYVGFRADKVIINDIWTDISPYKNMLVTWTPSVSSVNLAFVVNNNKIQLFVDGAFLTELALSDVVSGIADNADVSVGLLTNTYGLNGTIEFSDIEFTTDSADVEAYNRIGQFAKTVPVGSNTVASAVTKWDLSQVASNTVVADNTHGSTLQPLYFAETGKEAYLHFTASVRNESPKQANDPMAGIWFNDGNGRAFIGVRGGGIYYAVQNGGDQWHQPGNYWQDQILAPTWGGPATADIDFVIKDGNITLYIKDAFQKSYSKTLSMSDFLPNWDGTTDLAYGLVGYSNASTYAITFSNISFTTDLTVGQFAKAVAVNNKLFKSPLDKWDLSNVENNTVVAKNTLASTLQPLYFAETGKQARVHMTATVSNTQAGDPMAGIWLDDGTGRTFIGVRGSGLFYGKQNTGENWLGDGYWSKQELAPTWGGVPSVELDFLVKDGKVKIFVNKTETKTLPMTTLFPNYDATKDMVFGLVTYSNVTNYNITLSNIEFTTDSAKIQKFADAYIFASKVTVNGKTVNSNVSNWDISNLANGEINATLALNSSLKPLYFAETGKQALLQLTANTHSASVTHSDPMVGIWFNDGNGRAFVGVRGNGLFYGKQNVGEDWYPGLTPWEYQELSPHWGGPYKANIDFVVADGKIKIFVNDIFQSSRSTEVAISSLLPNWDGTTDLAYGVVMYTNADKCEMNISNISFTTDASAVAAYLAE